MPNGTYGGVRGGLFSTYSIAEAKCDTIIVGTGVLDCPFCLPILPSGKEEAAAHKAPPYRCIVFSERKGKHPRVKKRYAPL